jgi:hypothetical protein
VLIGYFDEVKYNPPRQPYYWLGAIVVPATIVRDLEVQVGALAEECFGTQILSRETEFHATDVYHRARQFRSWTDIDRRLSILRRLLKVVDRRGEVFKISIRIDPALMVKPEDIEGWAFMFLVERMNQLLRAKESLGLLIGDYENESVTNRATGRLSGYRTTGGTPHYFGQEITNLVDTVHFSRSHLSRMLQLADAYTWAQQFAATGGHASYPGTDLLHFLQQSTELLVPDKYKHWPTKDSWYATTS